MVTAKRLNVTPVFIVLLLLVLASNILVYRLPLPILPVSAHAKWVVIGSVIDFAIVAPLLILAITRKKGFTIKRGITFMVIGAICARIIIPASYFEPIKFIPYIAIGIEGIVVLAEIGIILLLLKNLPKIIKVVKQCDNEPLFSLSTIVEKQVSSNRLIKIICAEITMMYYALGTWKEKASPKENEFTLHTKTSAIAFYIMLIHAIVIETVGLHWWLHDKSLILSIVLLVLNIYTVIYFIGEIQAIRFNPLVVTNQEIRVSLGLGKRMVIPFDQIKKISWGNEAAEVNLRDKGIIDFIARDFEEVKPQLVISFKKPLPAIMLLGFTKKFNSAAIRVDEPGRLQAFLESKKELPSTES